MVIEIDAPLVAHDEEIAGDVVFDLRLNHVWRRFVGGILMQAMNHIEWIGTDPEIEQAKNWYSELIADFYTEAQGIAMLKMAARLRPTGGFLNVDADVLTVVEWADPALNNRDYDYGGFYDVANPEVLTIPANRGGIYNFSANVFYTDSAGGVKSFTSIDWNNAESIAQSRDAKDDFLAVSISGDFECVPGDEIRLKVISPVDDLVVAHFELHRVFS